MNMRIVSSEEVNDFLSNLKFILNSEDFDPSNDLDILSKKKSESATDPFTTFNTLQELSFDRYDVVEQLFSLELSDYVETFIDSMDSTLPSFYTFGKEIQRREVYIKVKIRDRMNNKIFCVSFHFAKFALLHNRVYV